MTDGRSKRGKLELCDLGPGSASIRDTDLGEAMHSSIGPEEESRIIYADQSDFPARLSRGDPDDPLVIFDLGLGVAANPVAALERIGRSPRRPVEIHSFENETQGLELALENLDRFPFLRPWAAPLRCVLDQGHWRSPDGKLRWTLHIGDFRESRLPDSVPELIYFDFYSPRSQPALWTEETFARLRAKSREESVLLTYSSSTSIRAALLLAGFFVGKGAPTAAKFETTLAAASHASLSRPLGPEFLDKLKRSSHAQAQRWRERLCSHPQFIT